MKIVIVSNRVGGGMPGVENPSVPVVRWEEVCHEPHIGIHYDEFRDVSRWNHVERKHRYHVKKWANSRVGMAGYSVGYYKTVEKAIAVAKKYAKE